MYFEFYDHNYTCEFSMANVNSITWVPGTKALLNLNNKNYIYKVTMYSAMHNFLTLTPLPYPPQKKSPKKYKIFKKTKKYIYIPKI